MLKYAESSLDNLEVKDDKNDQSESTCYFESLIEKGELAPINLSPYFHDSSENDRNQVAQELLHQLGTDGFALIQGTGLSSDMCMDALHQSKAFLYDAPEAVRRSCMAQDRARRGYSPSNTENFASLLGEKGPNDLVRKFRIGPSVSTNSNTDGSHGYASNTSSSSSPNKLVSTLHQPNVWPSDEVWGEEKSRQYRSSLERYYREVCPVAHKIVDILCQALILVRPNIAPTLEPLCKISHRHTMDSHTSILTILNYSKGARHQGSNGKPLVAPHTDVGVITLLLFDAGDCAVLQRYIGARPMESRQPRCWKDVTLPPELPKDPIFVVNVGDCFSDLCEGMLSSTVHRVMPCVQGIQPRTTLALFVGLGSDDELTLSDGNVSYAEWRRRRIGRAQLSLSSSN
jgi:isopenicillin N synthase-like dioxygenase